MGTARYFADWTKVQDKMCACRNVACARSLELERDQRRAIADAQQQVFEEPGVKPTPARKALRKPDDMIGAPSAA